MKLKAFDLFRRRLGPPRRAFSTAFSFLEMLVVIAVISLISALGIVFYGRYHQEVLLKVRDQRNAQEIASIVMGAQAAGAPVLVEGDFEATIANLLEGKTGTVGTFQGKTFRLGSLSADEIRGACRFLVWQEGLPTYRPQPK